MVAHHTVLIVQRLRLRQQRRGLSAVLGRMTYAALSQVRVVLKWDRLYSGCVPDKHNNMEKYQCD